MTDVAEHEPPAAADDAAAIDTASPSPVDEGPGPAPERSTRRVRRGVGLGTLAAVAVVASTSIGIGTHLALSEQPAAPVIEATAAPALPDPVALDEVKTQLGALADEVDATRRQQVSATGDRLQEALTAALPKLMLEIRVARDARLKKGDKKRLAGPFTAEELAAALPDLKVTSTGQRLVTDRDGNIVAPVGVKAPEGVELAAPGSDAAVKVWTLGEGEQRTVVARRCLVKEKHCLVEQQTFEVPAIDVTAATALLDRAATADSALRDAVATLSAPRETVVASTNSQTTPVLAGGLAALLAAMLLGFFVRRQLRDQTAAVAAYASSLASGTDAPPPRRTAGELLSAVEALIVIARQRDDDRARAAGDQARRERWSAWSSQLDRVAEGALDARLAPAGDALEVSVAEGVNRVVAALDQRVAQLQRHLVALAPDKTSASSRDASGLSQAAEVMDTLHKRIDAIRPLTGLLADIATRLKALGAVADEGSALQRDLVRLGEAVGSRAKTAQSLVTALEHDLDQLKAPAPAGEGLTEDARSALEALTADLDALGIAPTLAHQMAAEGRFTWAA